MKRKTQPRKEVKHVADVSSCQDLLKAINDYVDGGIDPAMCAELEKHLAGCNPCQVVVDNVRQTITLFKKGQPYDLPVGFHDRLHAALRERWAGKRK
jgi:RNA polymerase sigma-70 factor (ECF subfamily)